MAITAPFHDSAIVPAKLGFVEKVGVLVVEVEVDVGWPVGAAEEADCPRK